jgi:hypothetical protein
MVQSSFKLVWMESTSHKKKLTDWPLVEVALLVIGLTHISLDKNQY